MAFLEYQEEGDDTIFSKALWRRQNSERLTRRRGTSTLCKDLPSKTGRRRHRMRRAQLHRSSKGKHIVKAGHQIAERPIAEWPDVMFADWFRSVLIEQGSRASQSSTAVPIAFSPATCNANSELEFPPLRRLEKLGEAIVATDFDFASPSLPTADTKSMVDAETQCSPEDIVNATGTLLAASQFGHKRLLTQLQKAAIAVEIGYSVDNHFKLFADPSEIAASVQGLSIEEMKMLPRRFLGEWIAGMPVVRQRSSRRVAERYVIEAATIARNHVLFREGLLMSARRLLLGGFTSSPFFGQGLLQLAYESPTSWAKVAYTATDFAGRLVEAGALPRAFAAELLAGLAELPPSDQGCKMLVLGLAIVLPAVRLSAASRPMALTGRASTDTTNNISNLADESLPLTFSMRRAESAPSILKRHRTIGTSLHLQDDLQPYTFVSMNGATKLGVAYEEIPPIPLEHLPDYWRNVAGGELLPNELERRTVEAEDAAQILHYRFIFALLCRDPFLHYFVHVGGSTYLT